MKMKNLPTTIVGLLLIGITIFLCFGFKPISRKVRFPDGYIPMWESQTSDAIATVLNTRNITRITPKFNDEGIEVMREPEAAEYLEVRFNDGQVLQIFEPLDEFLNRIRSSQ